MNIERPNAADIPLLRRALRLAEKGMFSASPNPRVGCVIRRGGKTIGEGWHRRAGEAHAEIIAMRECGGDLRGAEVFLTMEPCAHAGKTPPCAPQLAAAKPARVVCATSDPNPQTAGRGFKTLLAAGIKTAVAAKDDAIFQEAVLLNVGFFSRMIRGRPWLRLKIAKTIDGKTALDSGISRWISGEKSRKDAHRLRARSCAVITGIGTALADNPQLTARDVGANRQPIRVLVDRDLRAIPTMKIFGGGALVATAAAKNECKQFAARVNSIDGAGAEVLRLPDKKGKVDLAKLLRSLAERDMNEATVEAGRRLCGAFVVAGLADEMVLYQSPQMFGGGMMMLEMPPPPSPQKAARMRLRSCRRLGEDVKMVYECAAARGEIADATDLATD